MQNFEAIILGILITFIGALPFGLVNLTVFDASHQKGYREGMRIAHGAALIEVLFGITATFHILEIYYKYLLSSILNIKLLENQQVLIHDCQ